MKKITLKELMINLIHDDFMVIADDKENYNKELVEELAVICSELAIFYNKYCDSYQFTKYKDIAIHSQCQKGWAFTSKMYLEDVAVLDYGKELTWEDENE